MASLLGAYAGDPMTQRKSKKPFCPLFVALIMIAAPLLATPGDAAPVTPGQEGAIASSSVIDDAKAPHGEWQTTYQWDDLFLNGPANPVNEAPDPGDPDPDPQVPLRDGSTFVGGILEMEPPTHNVEQLQEGPLSEAPTVSQRHANNDPTDVDDKQVQIGYSADRRGCFSFDVLVCSGAAYFDENVAKFALDVDHSPQEEVRIHGVAARIHARCDSNPGGLQGSPIIPYMRLYPAVYNASSDRFEIPDDVNRPITSVPLRAVQNDGSGFTIYEGMHDGNDVDDFGSLNPSHGVKLDKDTDAFVVHFAALRETNIGTEHPLKCVLHFGSENHASRISLLADSVRLNVWTEDPDGDPSDAFPSAATAASDDRDMRVRIVQASPWRNAASVTNTEYLPVQTTSAYANVLDPGETYNRVFDHLQIFNASGGKVFSTNTDVAMPFKALSVEPVRGRNSDDQDEAKRMETVSQASSVVSRTYTLTYSPQVEDGNYNIQVFLDPQRPEQGSGSEGYPTPTRAHGWSVDVPFAIGLKGFEFELADNEVASHKVNPGEPTKFYLQLNNTGTETDTFAISSGSNLPAGWDLDIGDASQTVAAGSTGRVTVEVTPPATALDGSKQSVSIRAVSRFATELGDEGTKNLVLNVNVTTDRLQKVDLSTTATHVNVRPGLEVPVGVQMQNLGYATDTYVVSATKPADAAGWVVAISPTAKEVVSSGRVGLNLRVTAPPEATAGQTMTMNVNAVEIANSTIKDTITFTFKVIFEVGLELEPYDDWVRTVREVGEECNDEAIEPDPDGAEEGDPASGSVDGATCDPYNDQVTDQTESGFKPLRPILEDEFYGITGPELDHNFSNRILYRIPVHNLGDRTDTFDVSAEWNTGATEDHRDVGGCNSYNPNGGAQDPDGIPDGWRFTYGDGNDDTVPGIGESFPDQNGEQHGRNRAIGFSGTLDLGQETVEARSTKYVYVELGYLSYEDLGTIPPRADVCPDDDPITWPLQESVTVVDSGTSSEAALTVTFRSREDPSIVESATLIAKVEDAGNFLRPQVYDGARHKPAIELDLDEEADKTVKPDGTVSYKLRALNKGNEEHDLKITVPTPPSGWKRELEWRDAHSVPQDVVFCEEVSDRELQCDGLDSYSEVAFWYNVTAPGSARIGIDRDTAAIQVTSLGSGSQATLALSSRVTGDFAYDAMAVGPTTREVNPAGSVSFPFTIDNFGTAGDEYNITVIESAGAAWKPQLSAPGVSFVPGGHKLHGFLTVTAPANVQENTKHHFRVQIETDNVQTIARLDFDAEVKPASDLLLAGEPNSKFLLPERGVAHDVQVKVTDKGGISGNEINFSVVPTDLPEGWIVRAPGGGSTVTEELALGGENFTATATFEVIAPEDAISDSRVVLRVKAERVADAAVYSHVDLALDVARTQGIELVSITDINQTVSQGAPKDYVVAVRNLGLGSDVVDLSTSQLPTGWTARLSSTKLGLAPLEVREVTLEVTAPADATPRATTTLVLFATSGVDANVNDDLVLRAEVGYHEILPNVDGRVEYIAPGEAAIHKFNLTNNGTLPDRIQVDATLATTVYDDNVSLQLSDRLVELEPGASQEVTLAWEIDVIPAGVELSATVDFLSINDPSATPESAEVDLRTVVLDYVAQDVDGDGLDEFAIDRNRDPGDGFEAFRDSVIPGGKVTRAPDITRFLSDEARESFIVAKVLPNGTTREVFDFKVDGDKDNRADFLLDKNGDGLPDLYWDPDQEFFQDITTIKDVDLDQVPDYFVDLTGDGDFNAVYNLRTGRFIDLLRVDINNDGRPDYVVDANGNHMADEDETVLLSRSDRLVVVKKVDVDGNGQLDDVYDEDGDGRPDYFVPAGSEAGVEIVMEDATGDGVLDWTYDADNDGVRESYFDPVTGEAGLVDAESQFVESLKKYWYVVALFLVVLVLFIVLVAVTRKR